MVTVDKKFIFHCSAANCPICISHSNCGFVFTRSLAHAIMLGDMNCSAAKWPLHICQSFAMTWMPHQVFTIYLISFSTAHRHVIIDGPCLVHCRGSGFVMAACSCQWIKFYIYRWRFWPSTNICTVTQWYFAVTSRDPCLTLPSISGKWYGSRKHQQLLCWTEW